MGRIPHQWKTTPVAPIFMKGDRNNAANYRLVPLTFICCKMCEHIIIKSIIKQLEHHGLFTDSQHGFRAKSSCKIQLLTLADDLLQGMTQGKQYDLAIMDFSNTFDVVPLKSLLEKAPVYKRTMPGLDRSLPEEQIPTDCSRW